MATEELQDKLQRYLAYIAQDENNINLLLSTSDCYRQLNDLTLAQRYLDKAKQQAGLPFWSHQGLVHLEENNIVLAKAAFTQALNELDSPFNRYHLGLTLFLNQELAAALAILESADNIEVVYGAQLLKAKILHHFQRIDEAILILERILILDDANDEVMGFLALLYFDNEDEVKAEQAVHKTLAINPSNHEGQLVGTLLDALHGEATLSDIKSLLADSPNNCRLWYALGTTQMQQMNMPSAEQAFLRATQIWPDFYDSWICLGWCYLLQNNLNQAEKAYQHAIEIDAEGAEGYGGLALVNALCDHEAEAKNQLTKSESIDADCFLATVTRMILANSLDPEQAANRFKGIFPTASTEMNGLLAQALLTLNADENTIH